MGLRHAQLRAREAAHTVIGEAIGDLGEAFMSRRYRKAARRAHRRARGQVRALVFGLAVLTVGIVYPRTVHKMVDKPCRAGYLGGVRHESELSAARGRQGQ